RGGERLRHCGRADVADDERGSGRQLSSEGRLVHRVVTCCPEVGMIPVVPRSLRQSLAAVETVDVDLDARVVLDRRGVLLQRQQAIPLGDAELDHGDRWPPFTLRLLSGVEHTKEIVRSRGCIPERLEGSPNRERTEERLDDPSKRAPRTSRGGRGSELWYHAC